MKKAIRYGIALASLVLFGSQAFAQVTIKMPRISFAFTETHALTATPEENTALKALNDVFDPDSPNAVLSAAMSGMTSTINGQLDKFDKQEKLAQGFGNATVYAGQGATMQGYQGYKLFSVMGGGIAGLQLPSMNLDELAMIPQNIMDKSDLYAGIAATLPVFNLGINAETVFGLIGLGDLFNNLYFNLKVGAGNLNQDFTVDSKKYALAMESFTFGVGVNYQLLPSIGILGGLVRWRGVNLGSGFTVQNSSFSISLPFNPLTQTIDNQNFTLGSDTYTVSGTMEAKPVIKLGSSVTTFTIPLEATTSVQALWVFNMNLGVGADFVFGSSDIIAEASSSLNVTPAISGGSNLVSSVDPGSITLDLGTKGVSPSLTRARIMAGLGSNFGPLKIDVPVYYYLNSGFAIGMTVGVVW